jgi:DNA polymerase-1
MLSQACKDCPIYLAGQYAPVPNRGPKDADIVLIGEAPGRDEARIGAPFVGKSGQLLEDLIARSGLSRQHKLRMTNAVRCRPSDAMGQNRTPTTEEVMCCRPHLEAELHQVKPRAIIPLGNIALQSIHKKTRASGITQVRGIPSTNEEFACLEIPTLHPANILRDPGRIPTVEGDFHRVIERLKTGNTVTKTAYGVIDTWEKFAKVMAGLRKRGLFMFDLETAPYMEGESDGFDYHNDEILCIAFSWEPHVGVVLPLFQWPDTEYWGKDKADILLALKSLMEDPTVKKVAHNAMFDCQFLRGRFDIRVQGLVADTMLMHYQLNENDNHGLKELAARLTDMGDYDAALGEFLKQYRTRAKKHYGQIPTDMLYAYAAADVDATFRLYNMFKAQLDADPGLKWVQEEILMPLLEVLMDITYEGVAIDEQECINLRGEYSGKMTEIAMRLQQKAGYPIKVTSTDHLRAFLFGYNPKSLPIESLDFQYQAVSALSDKPSTNRSTLEELKEQTRPSWTPAQTTERHEVISDILAYRKMSKLTSTYLVGLLRRLGKDGRLHASYKIHGTVTGRLACSNPNLMNIPRAKGGVKTVFVPDHRERTIFIPGATGRLIRVPVTKRKIIEGDFSQAELRVMAKMSDDPTLKQAFNDDIDVHILVASEVFGIPFEDIVDEIERTGFSERRNAAKSVNFGLIYGRGVHSLAAAFGWTLQQAQDFVNKYFNRFVDVDRWMTGQKDFVREKGYVTNWFGAHRRLPNIYSSQKPLVSEAERQAINAPIQSTAAYATYIAMIKLWRLAREQELPVYRLLLTVHDSILAEVDANFADEWKDIQRSVMEEPFYNYKGDMFDVKMKADVELVDRWGQSKDQKAAIVEVSDADILDALAAMDEVDDETEEAESL